jgi:hypothetical protein
MKKRVVRREQNPIRRPEQEPPMPMTEDLDATLRSMLARELRRLIGLQEVSIDSLFDALDTPTASVARPWSWLHTTEARVEVPCLVLLLRPMAGTATGAAYLAPYAKAKRWMGHPDARVIDVASFIRAIEERTGRCFETGRLAVDAQFDGFRARLADLETDDEQPF